jgi:hypothetical protein
MYDVSGSGMKMKMFAVFMAVKFMVSMSGIDSGFATMPPEPKVETSMEMVVGSVEGKESNGSDKS